MSAATLLRVYHIDGLSNKVHVLYVTTLPHKANATVLLRRIMLSYDPRIIGILSASTPLCGYDIDIISQHFRC